MKKSATTARSKELGDLNLKVRYQNVAALKPYAGNARTHSDKQIAQIAASIRNFGFNNPVLVDAENRIIAGHGRVEAAKRLGLTSVPTIRLDHLSDAERRAYVIDQVRPLLSLAKVLEPDHRHLGEPQLPRSEQPAVTGEDACVLVNQDRVGPSKLHH